MRDGTGKVYPIDQVPEYSDHEDFAVFSLREPSKQVRYSKPGPQPKPNDTVFAVGNALGEGIVIRDGVRFELEVTSPLLKVGSNSILRLNFAFYHDRDAVVWDVAGLYAAEKLHSQNWILVARRTASPADLPNGFKRDWHKLTPHEFPHNPAIANENGETAISTTAAAKAPDGANAIYSLKWPRKVRRRRS